MADRLTEQQVSDLVALLRTDASIDAKAQQVTHIKSSIKQHNVPDACVAPLFEALRTASTSQHALLVNAGFTSLSHLLTRLSRQEPKHLSKEAARTLPLLAEKLGDQKEKFRTLALQSMAILYQVTPVEVERSIRNTAMAGKNPRAKEASLQWLLQMHQESGLQFRSYVPTLMELLEDADGMVRDAAKSTVIELFRNAPNAAKSDLKRQLKSFKVRPAIEAAIVKELIPTSSAAPSQPETPDESTAPVASVAPARPVLSASVSSMSSERPATPMLDNRAEQVEPLYVNTQRELDDIFRDMHFHFESRETEQNWLKREESLTKMRRLIAGNASTDFQESLLSGLRGLLDGIIKGVISLRTSLSKEGCSLVQDIAVTYGPAMDPMVEILMQTFIKLAAATKKISSQLANVTVDTIIGRATYNARIMQHIWGACQDKNVQPRLYATGWVKTVVTKEAHHKAHLEHSGGLDLLEKCIKKGLGDANPGVREKMRATYWTFATVWPAKAEMIMDSLDATAQKLLRNDPNNPSSSPKRTAGGAPRPGLGLSKSTMGASKPSLREAMMAQKRALATKNNLPARPGSAMAHFSPARTVSNSSTVSAASTATTATAAATRARPEAPASRGLSGAPVRPVRKRPERPELAPRPATAGPYSARNQEQSSPPESLRIKAITPKSTLGASPKRTAPKPRPGHAATASESNIQTPSKLAGTKAPVSASPRPSPRPSPAKTQASAPALAPRSSPKRVEDISLEVPMALAVPDISAEPAPSLVSPTEELTSDSPPPLKVYEDPFSSGDDSTPKPTFTVPVLEDKPVNEDAAGLPRPEVENGAAPDLVSSPEKTKQNARLLDSGISKVKAMTLDVHGFRKLQGVVRDNKAIFTDDKFDALLSGLFEFLESPLPQMAPEKVQDVKAQVLATIKLLLKRMRESFQPHVSRGLESLLQTRACYDARTHIVSGLELLSEELVTLGDASELTLVLSRKMNSLEMDVPGCRSLSMGLHVLKRLVDSRPSFVPTDSEMATLCGLASKCLESLESGVRMDAVQLCVALHARVGDARFWEYLKGVKDDPKSVITYYIVKRQREEGSLALTA